MNALKWTILALLVVGFIWAPAWLIALLLFEFGVRRGRTVTALWLENVLHRKWGQE